MSYLQKLSKNTASNFGTFIFGNSISLVSYSLLIRFLGLDDYGLLIFMSSIVGQLSFLDAGLMTSVTKFISQYNREGRQQEINALIISAFVYFIIVSTLIALLLLLLVSFDLLRLFKISDVDEVKAFVLIGICFIPVNWSFKVFNAALGGYHDFHFSNKIGIGYQVFSLIASIALAFNGFGPIWIFFARQALMILRGVIQFFRLRTFFKIKISSFRNKDLKKAISSVFSYSSWVFVNKFSSYLVNSFDVMIVSALIGVGSLPIYTGVVRLIKILPSINSTLTRAILPIASEVSVGISNARFNSIALRGLQALNSISVPICIGVLIFGEQLLALLGKDYLVGYARIFQFGGLIYVIVGARSFLNVLHLGDGRIIKVQALLALSTSLVYLASVFLLSSFLGTKGAILSLPITQLIMAPFWLFQLLRKTEMSLKSYLFSTLKGQSAGMTAFVVLFFLQNLFEIKSYQFLIELSIFLTITIFISWKFSFQEDVKSIVVQFSKKVYQKFQ